MGGGASPGAKIAVVAVGGALALASVGVAGAAAQTVGFSNNAAVDRELAAEDTARLLAGSGAEVDRFSVSWKYLQPKPAADLRFSRYDEIYAADVEQGVTPLITLAYAPEWADEDACAQVAGTCHAPPAREFLDEWAQVAAAMAERYPLAAGIEIWNEPNTAYFWRPRPDPAAYLDLLESAYAAIKAVDPAMKVVAGAVAAGPGSFTSGKISGQDFVGQLVIDGGIDVMDIVSLHPYPYSSSAPAWTALDLVTKVKITLAFLAIFGFLPDGPPPFWLTETGVSTTGPLAASEANQASLLLEIQSLLGAAEGVEMVLFHSLLESDLPADTAFPGFGVVTQELRRKPAYCALAASWGEPDACDPAPASITTAPASGVTQDGATLNADHDSNGVETEFAFDYGTTQTYGMQTPRASGGAATGLVGVSADVGDLTPSTTYHYRALAFRDGVLVARGRDRTLRTLSMPELSVADASVVEGNDGTTETSLTVSLSDASSQRVRFSYATFAATATESADYAFAAGRITVNPGETEATVEIQVKGDEIDEPDEELTLAIGSPANATIGDTEATLTITDDDPSPEGAARLGLPR